MNKFKVLLAAVFILAATAVKSQQEYKFEKISEVKTTSVKDQNRSGTCWSFATTSFIETEILREKEIEIDLSEMFFVYHAYQMKAESYVRFHGKTNFGPGGQAHDVLMVVDKHGLITENAFPGLSKGQDNHNHGELNIVLTAYLDALIKNKNGELTPSWPDAFKSLLDVYMGTPPKSSIINGENLSAKKLTEKVGFNTSDYVEITSFKHMPYYEKSLLKIPDNWTYSNYYNVPLDELMEIINNALKTGYSVCWDGDVSNKGFSHSKAVAVVPETDIENLEGTELSKWQDIDAKEYKSKVYNFLEPMPEKKITEEFRQKLFNNYTTTDDHLMHLTAIYKDKNGTLYYNTKNSWAEDSNNNGGYLKMSENYLRLNTIAIMVHKDAIPKNIKGKLSL